MAIEDIGKNALQVLVCLSVLLLHTPVKQVPYSIIELYYLLLC